MDVNSINILKNSQKRPEAPGNDVKKKTEKQQETPEVTKEASVVTKNELVDAVDNSNEIGQLLKRKLNFAIDENNKDKVVVTVVDEESGEVVRQVPPKEMLRISAHLQKLKDMNDQVMHAVKSVILDVTI